jgi:hypothetical protein
MPDKGPSISLSIRLHFSSKSIFDFQNQISNIVL